MYYSSCAGLQLQLPDKYRLLKLQNARSPRSASPRRRLSAIISLLLLPSQFEDGGRSVKVGWSGTQIGEFYT